ncbi:NADH dehydrogenase [ubiquinone] 1 beta subcomplex subunit 3-like [Ptychodera flava]|uniref:NADH dehydrogenase [ubiquinone] 1 beta subcomplex subunit 3-like n=1 Tax=Ptychodera flava TaxID=63121 RepID=UPI00396AA74D
MGKLPYEIPDWRKWQVKDVPELKEVEDLLARKGLKDPWLRNEVWRYQPLCRGVSMWRMLFKGFQWGAILFVAAVGVERALKGNDKKNDHH